MNKTKYCMCELHLDNKVSFQLTKDTTKTTQKTKIDLHFHSLL